MGDRAVTVTDPSSAMPAANWYPDNADPHLQRWWDGQQWTVHTAPRFAAAAPAAYAPNPTYGYASPGVKPAVNAIATRGMVFSLIGVVINPFFVLTICGIVWGIIGLTRASRFTPQYARRGQAIAAIVVGIGGMILNAVVAVSVYNGQHPGL